MKEGKSFCHIGGQLDQVGDRIGEELTHLFGLGLVCDASISFAQAERYRDLMAELQRRGGLVAPTVIPPLPEPQKQFPISSVQFDLRTKYTLPGKISKNGVAQIHMGNPG